MADDDDKHASQDIDWRALELEPPKKTAVSIRLDDDVLAFFKSSGRGYQTRINAVLRAFVRAHGHRDDET